MQKWVISEFNVPNGFRDIPFQSVGFQSFVKFFSNFIDMATKIKTMSIIERMVYSLKISKNVLQKII